METLCQTVCHTGSTRKGTNRTEALVKRVELRGFEPLTSSMPWFPSHRNFGSPTLEVVRQRPPMYGTVRGDWLAIGLEHHPSPKLCCLDPPVATVDACRSRNESIEQRATVHQNGVEPAQPMLRLMCWSHLAGDTSSLVSFPNSSAFVPEGLQRSWMPASRPPGSCWRSLSASDLSACSAFARTCSSASRPLRNW
jgi:hypothetical protein